MFCHVDVINDIIILISRDWNRTFTLILFFIRFYLKLVQYWCRIRPSILCPRNEIVAFGRVRRPALGDMSLVISHNEFLYAISDCWCFSGNSTLQRKVVLKCYKISNKSMTVCRLVASAANAHRFDVNVAVPALCARAETVCWIPKPVW